MLHTFIRKIRTFYYKKLRKMTDVDLNIMHMRRSGITVGEGCRIFTPIASNEPWLITIGDRVTISANVQFVTHDNGIIKVLAGKTDVVGPITVGDDCFIGMNAMLMLGVTIGENCIVGAGSVVTHSFPPHTVLAGNPARAICTTEEYAEKYRDRAIDFSRIPREQRQEFLLSHPELWVKR